ncbi:rhomboid family intramembrane serine protease [Sandaracinus amylolyticus]|uniref:rhomboid family intramembrane serine protease n=1 Tax=Sandaracinus amylolyticus TaxID=927083 RepID=UPI001F40EAD6|nr:rhomboid family intramembrane serine protease [Sandaracinus amylolyticus]UJR79951.1 Rhomboid protease GluP [Sandaracinus amylolyticus]
MVLPPQGPPPGGPAPRPIGEPSFDEPRAPTPRATADREKPRASGEERPFVTVAVVVANVLVMVLMIASGVGAMAPTAESLLGWGANFGPYTLGGQWWRLVTACFVHAGLLHLAFNMYVLWDLGRLTERVYGALGFTLVYLVAGIGGSLASVTINPMGVSVGASGAVFGVAGAFLAFLARNRGRLDPHVFAHLRRSLVTFVLINLALGFTVPGIDMAAHLGGLAMGFLSGLLASPTVTRQGPQRAYWAYPVVGAVGVAMCVLAWLGMPLVR